VATFLVLGPGTATSREQFSVKIIHKCCSSFWERSGSGDGNGNMATKVWMNVMMMTEAKEPRRYASCNWVCGLCKLQGHPDKLLGFHRCR
jgi:hypothetical protein